RNAACRCVIMGLSPAGSPAGLGRGCLLLPVQINTRCILLTISWQLRSGGRHCCAPALLTLSTHERRGRAGGLGENRGPAILQLAGAAAGARPGLCPRLAARLDHGRPPP